MRRDFLSESMRFIDNRFDLFRRPIGLAGKPAVFVNVVAAVRINLDPICGKTPDELVSLFK
jgi:hypothetical protein